MGSMMPGFQFLRSVYNLMHPILTNLYSILLIIIMGIMLLG